MKPFAEWSRERASLGLKALSDSALLLEQEAEAARAQSAAVEALEDLSMAVAESAALSAQLETASGMSRAGQAWLAETGKAIDADLDARFAGIEAMLSGKVAGVLMPLLTDTLRKKAVDDFCSALRQHISPALRTDVIVSAPAGMRSMLQAAVNANGLKAEIEDGTVSEISAQVSGMQIETNLTEWSQRLQELVEQ